MIKTIGIAALTLMLQAGAAAAQGLTPSDAAPPGVSVAGIIECGAGYNSHELYDVKINVLEVVRGDKALQMAKSQSAKAPAAGLDYVVARVKFEYSARGTPGDCNHELRPGQFVALSSQGKKYAPAPLGLKPELNATIRPGQGAEGWVSFLVPQADDKPLLTFTVSDAGADQHGGDMWFRLY
jgi:hypothetical protein